MLKKIEIHKDVLSVFEKVDKKTFDIMTKWMKGCGYQEYITTEQYYEGRNFPNDPAPKVIEQCGGIFLVEYEGVQLVESSSNKLKDLFEVHKKAADYDKLKKSLDHIKGVLE